MNMEQEAALNERITRTLTRVAELLRSAELELKTKVCPPERVKCWRPHPSLEVYTADNIRQLVCGREWGDTAKPCYSISGASGSPTRETVKGDEVAAEAIKSKVLAAIQNHRSWRQSQRIETDARNKVHALSEAMGLSEVYGQSGALSMDFGRVKEGALVDSARVSTRSHGAVRIELDADTEKAEKLLLALKSAGVVTW